jgi:transcriptional regulator with XRE-family HTH domain
MDMKIDPLKIKQLREAHGWSQEHLAEVASLSVRTVQRIEAEGNVSPESRMALAAALGVAAAELATFQTPTSLPAVPQSPEQRKGDWRRHAAIYILVCGGLLVFDITQHGFITWSKWPALGWSIGLLLHWLRSRSVTAKH